MTATLETAHVLLPLAIFGIDISITSAVIVLWLAAGIIFLLGYFAGRKASLVPHELQNLVEIIYEFWEAQASDILGKRSRLWLPFIIGIFLFVLAGNLLGMLPDFYPLTANINVTGALAVIVFFSYHVAGVMELGWPRYLKSLVPSGVPLFILPLMMVIELVSHLTRPFSLAIRLFANITAGHLIVFTLLSMIVVYKNIWLAGFPLLGRVVIGLFEVFVAFLQAYVFAYLATLYIGLAVSEE